MAVEKTTEKGVEDLYNNDEGFTFVNNKWGLEVDGEEAEQTHFGSRHDWKDPFGDNAEESTETTETEETDQYGEEEPLASSTVTSVEGSEEESEEELPEIDNPIFFIAKQAVEDGLILLGEDETVPEDVDLGFVYNKYKESIRPKAEADILQEVNQRLENAGIRQEHLPLLQAMENGVPQDELYLLSKFQKYATSNPDEVDTSKKLEIIKEWYTARELTDKEIRRQLEAIDINDEVDSEFLDAQQFFGETVNGFAEQQRAEAIERERQTKELQAWNLQVVNNAITKKEVLGEKLTDGQAKELKNYIFQRDRAVDVGDNQRVPMSAYEEFLYRVNNDLEFALRAFKRDIFREKDLAVMKEVANEDADKDFISAYKKVQDRSSSKTSIKKNELGDRTKDSNGNTITRTPTGGTIMEFG